MTRTYPQDTMNVKILEKLSSSLVAVNYPPTVNVYPSLCESRRKVQLSFRILEALGGAGNLLPKGSRVDRKKGKVITKNHNIDPVLFDSMGITVPTTTMELRGVYTKILSQLRGTLEVCVFIASTRRI